MNEKKIQTYIGTELTPIVSEVRSIIEQGRKQAYAEVAKTAIMTYWKVGRRLVEEEQHGKERAAMERHSSKALPMSLSPFMEVATTSETSTFTNGFIFSSPTCRL